MFASFLDYSWIYFFAPLNFLLSLLGAIHVVLYKRDTRAAIAWVVVIGLVPFLGIFLYFCLGINRIRRRAHLLRDNQLCPETISQENASKNFCHEEELLYWLAPDKSHLKSLKVLMDHITPKPLLTGNLIKPLFQGDQAFPEMLSAIDSAQYSITLCTYIFNDDSLGTLFIDALERAIKRRVRVCVLIDAVGARYSPLSILKVLHKKGVSVKRFLPTFFPRSIHYSNLRNHRKILVIDGKIGFTGGMNIREEHPSLITENRTLSDIHFRLEGPVVRQLQETFATDWAFTTQEILEG
ncbi:MAG: phospholipase D-like domain-containing protein, partial [Planctomycetota bacterium]